MFPKRTIKWLAAVTLTTSSLLTLYPTTAHAVSKTPNFSANSTVLESSPAFQMPEDYPQELLDWYKENMDARSYVVIDQETNKILAEKDANVPHEIASMTKILAMYLIYKAIDEGKLTLDQEITPSTELINDIALNINLSNAGLQEGVAYPVKDLLYGIMLPSGNDATSAVMDEIYGSEQAAVMAMQQQLTDWGITNARIYTTSGAPNNELPESWWLPGSTADNENIMSAANMALVAQYTIEAYPQILEISSAPEYTFMEGKDQEVIFYNSSQLLPGAAYGREGITGLKSGFTDLAGMNFTATGTENGRKIIAVAMGVFGEGMSSYWEIEILLNGLLDYPDLYQKDLPTNLKVDPAAIESSLESSSDEEASSDETDPTLNNLPNRRNNPITNFMRDAFNIFN